ncbi:MAG: hypothetical protein D6704_04230 [Nitrospirae bacterium]|nr:MAG: hypothetical protein D6704_04230 [Nitrospirota bacterium]
MRSTLAILNRGITPKSWAGRLSPECKKRILVAGMAGLSTLLLWWSLTVRWSLIAEAQSRLSSSLALSREIAALDADWSEDEAQAVARARANIERQLVHNYEHLGQWLTQVLHLARETGVHLKFQVKEVRAASPDLSGIRVIPLALTLTADDSNRSAYPAFMTFLRRVTDMEVYVDLKQVTMVGQGKGAQTMQLELEMWMQEAA